MVACISGRRCFVHAAARVRIMKDDPCISLSALRQANVEGGLWRGWKLVQACNVSFCEFDKS